MSILGADDQVVPVTRKTEIDPLLTPNRLIGITTCSQIPGLGLCPSMELRATDRYDPSMRNRMFTS